MRMTGRNNRTKDQEQRERLSRYIAEHYTEPADLCMECKAADNETDTFLREMLSPEEPDTFAREMLPPEEPGVLSGARAAVPYSLEEALKYRDESFHAMLFRLIKEKGMKNSEVYTKANLSKAHFSKLKNEPRIRPKKETVLALAVALRLNLTETQEFLMKAGYALSHSFLQDVIVEYFIVSGQYNIMTINDALFDYDQPLLGERAI